MNVETATAAVARIQDGATVLVDGSGGGVNEPGLVLEALEARFLEEGHPRDLTLIHISGMGGDANGGGIDRFAHDGMVRRVIGGHWGWTPRMQALAVDERIEAYCLPQGVLSHLMREIAGQRAGVVSKVGIGTFVDPRLDGGRLNKSAVDDVVHLVDLLGEEYLFTPTFAIDVAIIRGTAADADGNLHMDDEGLFAETLSAAQAASNSGGIVIAQVRELLDGRIDPRRVRVPGVLIDSIVAAPDQRLSFATQADPTMTGAERSNVVEAAATPLDVRKVIARRAALELHRGDVVNLGYGMPDGVSAVLAEEHQSDSVTFTVEQGHIGGNPVGGSDFGLARNQSASLDAGHQFDWYDGGGLDLAVLSFAELDKHGNVNVGRFGGRIPGVGGFINNSPGARRLVFVGTFFAGAKYSMGKNGVPTAGPGAVPKLVDAVEQISFSARTAASTGQPVVYVTERAVFTLDVQGLRLVEIAPGLDVKRDVLDHLPFRPALADDVAVMDPRIFLDAPLGLELLAQEGD